MNKKYRYAFWRLYNNMDTWSVFYVWWTVWRRTLYYYCSTWCRIYLVVEKNSVESHFVKIEEAQAFSVLATNKSNAFRENCPEHFQRFFLLSAYFYIRRQKVSTASHAPGVPRRSLYASGSVFSPYIAAKSI